MVTQDGVPEHLEKYRAQFDQYMADVDKLAQAINTGHLIIEGALQNILETIFVHPEHVRDARLTFSQKVHLARGLALNKNRLPTWNLISSINAVRNEIAHNLAGERRTQKMDQLRRLYLDGNPEFRDRLKDAPDEAIAYLACVECTGFLGAFEHDMRGLREHIDALAVTVKEANAMNGKA